MKTYNLSHIALHDAAVAAHLAEIHRSADARAAMQRGLNHSPAKARGIRLLAARVLSHLVLRLDPASPTAHNSGAGRHMPAPA